MRTSETHPLEIAEIAVGGGLGKIGLTFCPGKTQQNSMAGGWQRDLAVDLDVAAAWGAAAVVTLIESSEMADLSVTELGDYVADRHMSWFHVPIRDVDPPDDEFEARWEKYGETVRSIIRSGFNVLVHCKGGLGRAGMISARLLVELGWDPERAISTVRRVRNGAIETGAQEQHVRSQVAIGEPPRDSSQEAVEDRALGCLLGLAVGDAVGTTLEFSKRDTKPRLTDMIGGGPFGLEPGYWTDDTSMALALADSLIVNGGLDEKDLMRRFCSWWRHGHYSATGSCFDIGITTRQALSRFKTTGDPISGSRDQMSAGNGSLMRLAPVVLHGLATDKLGAVDVAVRQSLTTHAAPACVDACRWFAFLLYLAIVGKDRRFVFEFAGTPETESVAAILSGSWRGKHRNEVKSSGYVIHSLEAALWCVARTGSFEDAVLLAANLGDDADTTAAITGQLAGALYGMSAIPEGWLEKLAWREKMARAGRALLRGVSQDPIFV